jgi:hypothetical protein
LPLLDVPLNPAETASVLSLTPEAAAAAVPSAHASSGSRDHDPGLAGRSAALERSPFQSISPGADVTAAASPMADSQRHSFGSSSELEGLGLEMPEVFVPERFQDEWRNQNQSQACTDDTDHHKARGDNFSPAGA